MLDFLQKLIEKRRTGSNWVLFISIGLAALTLIGDIFMGGRSLFSRSGAYLAFFSGVSGLLIYLMQRTGTEWQSDLLKAATSFGGDDVAREILIEANDDVLFQTGDLRLTKHYLISITKEEDIVIVRNSDIKSICLSGAILQFSGGGKVLSTDLVGAHSTFVNRMALPSKLDEETLQKFKEAGLTMKVDRK